MPCSARASTISALRPSSPNVVTFLLNLYVVRRPILGISERETDEGRPRARQMIGTRTFILAGQGDHPVQAHPPGGSGDSPSAVAENREGAEDEGEGRGPQERADDVIAGRVGEMDPAV